MPSILRTESFRFYFFSLEGHEPPQVHIDKGGGVCTEAALMVSLSDGRSLQLPLAWYPTLLRASPAERAEWEVSAAGAGIHWPKLDLDLSLSGLLEGRRERVPLVR